MSEVYHYNNVIYVPRGDGTFTPLTMEVVQGGIVLHAGDPVVCVPVQAQCQLVPEQNVDIVDAKGARLLKLWSEQRL